MPVNLQPVLSCREDAASDVPVSLNGADHAYDVYVGVALMERFGADPEIIQHKMLVGRLCNAGGYSSTFPKTKHTDPSGFAWPTNASSRSGCDVESMTLITPRDRGRHNNIDAVILVSENTPPLWTSRQFATTLSLRSSLSTRAQ